VLDAKGQVGARATVREVAFDTFVPQVWTQLLIKAAVTWTQLGEAGAGWQDAVLDAVARMVCPSTDTATARRQLETQLAAQELPDHFRRPHASRRLNPRPQLPPRHTPRVAAPLAQKRKRRHDKCVDRDAP
jgi:hypothetical protein